jgi:hypothetical protein
MIFDAAPFALPKRFREYRADVGPYLRPDFSDRTAERPRVPFAGDRGVEVVVEHDVLRTPIHLAEIMGLAPGYCRGRGGSMRLPWREAGVLGTNAIVGGGVPLAAGAAWAHKRAGSGDVAVTYFGDGAVNIGSVLETMNLAAAWKLPLIFFIENNQYAVATTVAESTAEPRLAARGLGFAIPAWRVDGMNPLAVMRRRSKLRAPEKGRRLLRPMCIATSTRTDPCRAAPSAIAVAGRSGVAGAGSFDPGRPGDAAARSDRRSRH